MTTTFPSSHEPLHRKAYASPGMAARTVSRDALHRVRYRGPVAAASDRGASHRGQGLPLALGRARCDVAALLLASQGHPAERHEDGRSNLPLRPVARAEQEAV